MSYGKYAVKQNIYVEQGTDWEIVLAFKDSNGDPYDLTSYANPTCQLRSSFDASSAVDVTCTIDNDPTTGKITLSLTKAETSGISFTDNKGVWDLEIDDPSGNTRRLVQGEVFIMREATKA